MFKQLKRFFGGSNHGSATEPASPVMATTQPGFKPFPARSPGPLPTPAVFTPEGNTEEVSIPLQSVLNALPPALKCRVIPTELGGATLTVSLAKVLSQLPFGAVKLAFGVLRRAAPQLFSPGDQSDDQDFELPLNELLTRIHPTLLPRSPSQQVAICTDTLDQALNPPEASMGDDAIPEFCAPPKAISARPTRGPIRVPVPGDVKANALATPSAPTAPYEVQAETAPSTFTPTDGWPAAPETPGASAPGGASVTVPLVSLTAGWSNAVRAEIEQLDCVNAQVALPESLVQAGMKQGKVAFPWQTLRAWIIPTPPLVVSRFDDTPLELPLEVLMPLFLSRWQQTPRTQPKLVVDESIPALFTPAAPPAHSDLVLDGQGSNFATTTSADDSIPNTPDTDLKIRYTSPTEIVARATALKGVAGALAVLPEGLLVASKFSSQHDPDALAAFLAHALGKMVQYANEAQVGELSRLQFWADDVPWLIYRLNGVLLAAFGLAGGSLPVAELTALAGELDGTRMA